MVGADRPLRELPFGGDWRWLQVENLAQLESDLIDVAAGRADLYLLTGDPASTTARAARHSLKVSPLSQDLHACHLTAGGGEGCRSVGRGVGLRTTMVAS